MKFESAMNMYHYIKNGNDLYNPKLGIYVFIYNDRGALCYYKIDPSFAKELCKTTDNWSELLGPGGYILDDESGTEEQSLTPSYDFCKQYFALSGWINTSEM